MRSGADGAFNDAFLALCDTFPGKDRPRTIQATAAAVMKRYGDGGLAAKQLVNFISALYEVVGRKPRTGSLDVERGTQEGSLGKVWLYEVRGLPDRNRSTRKCQGHDRHARRAPSIPQRNGGPIRLNCKSWFLQSREKVRWMDLASLARATYRVPEVAKYCLNKASLVRLQCKTGLKAI